MIALYEAQYCSLVIEFLYVIQANGVDQVSCDHIGRIRSTLWLAARVKIARCMKSSRRSALVGTESYIGTYYCHAVISLSTSQARLPVREQVKSRRISLAMLNRHLRHWWKTCQMGAVAMMSVNHLNVSPYWTEPRGCGY